MSRRFGRQQKRKLTAQLALQTAFCDNLTQTVADRDRRNHELMQSLLRLRRTVDDALSILGEDFVAAEPRVMIARDLHELVNVHRIPLYYAARHLSDESACSLLSVTTHDVQLNRLSVDADLLRSLIHVRYTTPAGMWA